MRISFIQDFRNFIFKDHPFFFIATCYKPLSKSNPEDEKFVDGQLTTKSAKFTSLENLYAYGNKNSGECAASFANFTLNGELNYPIQRDSSAIFRSLS